VPFASSFRIFLDECVQAGVARALTDDGHDVVRPVASGTSDSPSDEAVLESAAEQDRVLVTTDTDLLAVHTRWITHGKSHPGIVIGQQDQNLKRFLRNLRYTLKGWEPAALRDRVIWIEKAG
jgi:predicted nuclease of predicted toxin-antitoxin system